MVLLTLIFIITQRSIMMTRACSTLKELMMLFLYMKAKLSSFGDLLHTMVEKLMT